MTTERTQNWTRQPSRRRLLRAGCGSLAATIASSTAGCLATLPMLGQRIRYGNVNPPESNAPHYRRWAPARSAFENPPESDSLVDLMYAEPNRLRGEVIGRFPADELKSRLDYFGIGYENYDRVVRFGQAIAVEADFDRSTVVSTLSKTEYRSASSYRGYEVYRRSDDPRTVAIGDDEFVFSTAEDDAMAVIDAADGQVPRYHETNKEFEMLTGTAGSYPFTWITTHRGDRFDEPVPEAFSVTTDDDVYYVFHRVYPPGETPTVGQLKEDLNDDPRAVDARNADVEVDGRIVTITMRMSTDAYLEVDGVDDHKSSFPQITWGADHDEDARTLTIRHEVGETVDADLLAVTFGYVTGPETEAQFADEYDVVGPGDDLTVDLDDRPPGAAMTVVYNSQDGDSSGTGFAYEFDDAQ